MATDECSRDAPNYSTTWKSVFLLVAVTMGIVFLVVQLMTAIEKVHEDAERGECAHKQINLALHNYQSVHGRLPPFASHDPEGKPLLSWRVLILPFIEQHTLYEQFRLNEPWDSDHNIKLLPLMPISYRAPGRKAGLIPPFHTVCYVFVGKGAAFEGRQGLRIPDDFRDGVSATFLNVDAGKPVPWSKPDDLPFDPDQPLPDLKGIFRDGFFACMADHSRRWVKSQTSESTLRALITRNRGDWPGPDWPD